MTTQLRRFFVFQAFLFWQGGFLFYAAVVVPMGSDVLGAFMQGMVTQRVTDWLAVIGLGWHLVFAWDLWSERDPIRRRFRLRFGGWFLSLLMLGMLALVHIQLDTQLNAEDIDYTAFRIWHGIYLWGVTLQWLMGLVQAWLTLGVWTDFVTKPA